jgi:hypothetical protein
MKDSYGRGRPPDLPTNLTDASAIRRYPSPL